jgi:adenylate cyclase
MSYSFAISMTAASAGFGRLRVRDGKWPARLRAFAQDKIDPTISVHHGRVIKRTGDGRLVEFRSVVDAVRCAIEVQNAMVERNAGAPTESVASRRRRGARHN